VLTFDASSDLAAGETLTGTPTIAITMQRGSDPGSADVVTEPEINTQQIIIPLADGTQATIAAGHGVQAIASTGLDGCWYLAAITCTTSNPEKVLTLKGVLKVSAS